MAPWALPSALGDLGHLGQNCWVGQGENGAASADTLRADAGPGRHQLRPRPERPAARPLGRRPGGGGTKAGGRGRGLQLSDGTARVRTGNPAPAAPAAAAELRPRPRPLRARRRLRKAGRGEATAGHIPRHRRPPSGRGRYLSPAGPPDRLGRRASRGPCSHRRAVAPASRMSRGQAPSSPAASTWPGSGRSPAPRRGASSASIPRVAICSSRPTRRGRRSATIAPSSWRLPPALACSPAATSNPSGCRSG